MIGMNFYYYGFHECNLLMDLMAMNPEFSSKGLSGSNLALMNKNG